MKEIAVEIHHLEEEKAELDEKAETFLSTKSWATKKASEVTELQTRLTDANIVLEKGNQGLEAKGNFTYTCIHTV